MNRYELIKIWCKPKHPPIHTSIIFILCLVVYETNNTVTIHIPPDKHEPFYNYFATAVSHFSASHLLSNLSGIILFGTLLEIIHGTSASFFVYWIASGSGVLAEVAWNTDTVVYAGASPGVYGLIGAYLSHILLNWSEAPLRYVWAVFLLIQSIEVGILYLYDEEYRIGIAHFSHLNGFLQGVFVGLLTLRNIRVLYWEVWLQGIAVVASATCIIVPTLMIQ